MEIEWLFLLLVIGIFDHEKAVTYKRQRLMI